MGIRVDLHLLFEAVARWASEHENVVGLALIGSHARNEARPDSDVDFSILCTNMSALVEDPGWTGEFGTVRERMTEHYGPTCSLRVFYESGLEVEFGIADPSWASVPLDPGTRRVISDGAQILYDPVGLFAKACEAVAT